MIETTTICTTPEEEILKLEKRLTDMPLDEFNLLKGSIERYREFLNECAMGIWRIEPGKIRGCDHDWT